MNKLYLFIKKHFLTRKFIVFGLIGVVNTLIHMLVYGVFYVDFSAGAFFSNVIAFIIASLFSYFANAYLTFKPKHKTTMQFSAVIMVFLARLLVSSLMAWAFDYMIIHWFSVNYEIYPMAKYIAPFFASALLIPIAYLALSIVFKKTSDLHENKQN